VRTLGAPGSAGYKSGSAGDKSGSSCDKSGSTSNHSRAVREKHLLWDCCRCTWNAAGTPRMLQVRQECCRCARNPAGATGMLQVLLEIIATTYHSTIVKTQVFRLYSHLCINVSMYLYSYPSTHGISALAAGSS
jgi:hypothetical protein